MSQFQPVSDLAARLIAAKSQRAMVALLRNQVRQPTSKSLASDVKAHVQLLAKYLNDNRAGEAIATALAMMFLDADHAIACMRREGVLRASRYEFRGSLIGRVAKAALSVRELLTASPDRIVYLESVVALSRLAGNARALQKEIETTIRSRHAVVLKTVFEMVNN